MDKQTNPGSATQQWMIPTETVANTFDPLAPPPGRHIRRRRGREDAQLFKKHTQMKLPMKREALAEVESQANGPGRSFDTVIEN
jgi:hypothetical protein